ncbi:carbonic anhydrase [Synechococcus sp. GreenBA-s]|nr:carbonic anhydrase [Synechococcus sp. GreenBA-s]
MLQAAGIAAGTIAAPKLMPGVAKAADAMVPTLKQSLNAYPPPGDPLKALLERNETFSKAWQALGDDISPQERMALKASMLEQGCQNDRLALDEGQHPWAALISGADARVAPEWIFAACSGELFQVRVAGNSTFDDGIASLAYAVAVLEVPLILASGHSGCGAVKAAMVTKLLTPLLEDLAKPIRSSLKSRDDLTQAIEGKAHYAAGQLTKRSAVPKRPDQVAK